MVFVTDYELTPTLLFKVMKKLGVAKYPKDKYRIVHHRNGWTEIIRRKGSDGST